MKNETNTKTATIAVLYGYDTIAELAAGESCAAIYFMNAEILPFGGWSSQGMIEVSDRVTVSVDSNEYDSAKNNTDLHFGRRA